MLTSLQLEAIPLAPGLIKLDCVAYALAKTKR